MLPRALGWAVRSVLSSQVLHPRGWSCDPPVQIHPQEGNGQVQPSPPHKVLMAVVSPFPPLTPTLQPTHHSQQPHCPGSPTLKAPTYGRTGESSQHPQGKTPVILHHPLWVMPIDTGLNLNDRPGNFSGKPKKESKCLRFLDKTQCVVPEPATSASWELVRDVELDLQEALSLNR